MIQPEWWMVGVTAMGSGTAGLIVMAALAASGRESERERMQELADERARREFAHKLAEMEHEILAAHDALQASALKLGRSA